MKKFLIILLLYIVKLYCLSQTMATNQLISKTNKIHCFKNNKLNSIEEYDNKGRLIFKRGHFGQQYWIEAYIYSVDGLSERIEAHTMQPFYVFTFQKHGDTTFVLAASNEDDNKLEIDTVASNSINKAKWTNEAVSLEDKLFYESINTFQDVLNLSQYKKVKNLKGKLFSTIVENERERRTINLDQSMISVEEYDLKKRLVKMYDYEDPSESYLIYEYTYTAFDSTSCFIQRENGSTDTLRYTLIAYNEGNLPIAVSTYSFVSGDFGEKFKNYEWQILLEYDSVNKLKSEIEFNSLDKKESITIYKYDEKGRLIFKDISKPQYSYSRTEKIVYDDNNRVIKKEIMENSVKEIWTWKFF